VLTGETDDGDELFLATNMYTDWTAVILVLLTACALSVVGRTATFFIWKPEEKAQR